MCSLLAACTTQEPVQDPLDYLRIGVDPDAEAEAVRQDLAHDGYAIGQVVEGSRYVAFEAFRPPDTTVRVFTARGPAYSLQTPDLRAPHRARVALGSESRPDFDRDGELDVVLAIRELDRTCLLWLQVDRDGFVNSVFEPNPVWGDAPCVLDIDSMWPRLLLEVSVPNQPTPEARVTLPIHAVARGWEVDESSTAIAHWRNEIDRRREALASARAASDSTAIVRLVTELSWIEELRGGQEGVVPASDPVLEPPDDGKEAR